MTGEGNAPARRWALRRGGGAPSRRTGRRRWLAARPYLAVLAVVATAAGGAWVAYNTDVLGVHDVTVAGARTVSTEQVVAAAAITPGVSLLRVDTGRAADRVGELPAVASARVERRWPHTVVVHITERRPAAAVPAGAAYRLVDAGGVPFRTVRAVPRGVPVVQVGAPGPDDKATLAALTVVADLTPALRGRLTRVVAPTPEQVELRLRDGRVIFWGGPEDGARKVVVAGALLRQPGRRIDVSAPGVATVR